MAIWRNIETEERNIYRWIGGGVSNEPMDMRYWEAVTSPTYSFDEKTNEKIETGFVTTYKKLKSGFEIIEIEKVDVGLLEVSNKNRIRKRSSKLPVATKIDKDGDLVCPT